MSRTLIDLGLMGLALVAGTAIAELLGAANMGTALTFGEIAVVVTLGVLVLGPRSS